MQPGETGKIPIKISTHKGSGHLSKSITVNTNVAGADSTLRLTIKGEVWQPVQVSPPSAAFGRITATQATSDSQRKLTIVNNIEGDLKLTNLRVSNPKFKAEIRPLEAGKKFELIVSLVPPLESGNNTGKITIDTGLDNPATLDVPVYAFLTAPVDVTPTQLTLMPGRSAPMKRQFYIRSHDQKTFEISDLKCTSEALKLTLNDIRESKTTYQLIVDIPADYSPPPTGDQITFKTSHPAAPAMSIPVQERGPIRRPSAAVGRGAKFTGKPTPVRKAPAKPEVKKRENESVKSSSEPGKQ